MPDAHGVRHSGNIGHTNRQSGLIPPPRSLRVAMYDVHDHGETHPVRLIDQLFQLVRRTETGRGGEEATYVIAERSIIGMFLYSHDLNGVITILRYTRQYILTEFIIRPHLLLVGAHTDMALVDQKGRLLRFEPFILEFIRFLRVPYLSAEYLRLLICTTRRVHAGIRSPLPPSHSTSNLNKSS